MTFTSSLQLGTLYGLSIGPGDPELITLKALRLLKSAPIIAYPAGLNGQPGLAQKAISQWLSSNQTQVPLHFPYVQDPQALKAAWSRAAETLLPFLQDGKDVAFACEGDVSLYSTFSYLAAAVKNSSKYIAITTVPGITSSLAAAAQLGWPLTQQQQGLAIIPALYAQDNLQVLDAALGWAETLVLLKINRAYPLIWNWLARHNLLRYAAVVERATQPEQLIYQDLRDQQDLKLSYFSLLIVKRCGL
ncbi:MAG: precorrin-2 C(20)-methyltransferase [Cyanobacteria bacterium P01_H01_bin.15]